jgi:hypothetical protein
LGKKNEEAASHLASSVSKSSVFLETKPPMDAKWEEEEKLAQRRRGAEEDEVNAEILKS